MLGGALPGRVLLRAGSTRVFGVWALSVYMPIFLALHAHSTPSPSAVGPIGVHPELPDRPLSDRVVGDEGIGELDRERALMAPRLSEPAHVRDLHARSQSPRLMVLRDETALDVLSVLSQIHGVHRNPVDDNPPGRNPDPSVSPEGLYPLFGVLAEHLSRRSRLEYI
jgi:hypothetical protein